MPQTEQTPFIAGRPFFIFVSWVFFIVVFCRHFTQYALSSAIGSPGGEKLEISASLPHGGPHPRSRRHDVLRQGERYGSVPAVNTEPLRYVDSGETSLPLLFFIHGWPDSTKLWTPLVDHFRGRYRTVCVDLPAYGSDARGSGADFSVVADRLAATLRKVTTPRPPEVVVVGHDWGAYLTYHVERRHPDLMDRLVTMDVGAHIQPEGPGHMAFLVSYQWWLIGAWGLGKVLPPVGNAMSKLFASYAHAPDVPHTRARMNYLYAYFWRARLFGKSKDTILRRYQPTKPLLYLYGQRNPYKFHSRRWLEIVTKVPRSRVVPIDGFHWFPLHQAKETAAAMDHWLAAGT